MINATRMAVGLNDTLPGDLKTIDIGTARL
jgi:hypothetical protein